MLAAASQEGSVVQELEGVSRGEAILYAGFVVLSVLVSIVASTWKRLHWIHESTVVLLFGTLVGLLVHFLARASSYTLPTELFTEVFYAALLPPIIFNAGFTMKKRNFMKNIGSILTFAIIGTLVSSFAFGGGIYLCGKYVGFGTGDFIESMLFGALVSPNDTVSTIAILLDMNVDPLLYSLVFGESVLNDAVAIALVHTLSKFVGQSLSWHSIWLITRSFLFNIFVSLAIGIAVGLTCAFIKARQRKMNLSPSFDVSLLLLFAYFAYAIADYFDTSGVIALFVCAVIMSHYCWYTISNGARVALFTASGTLDYLATTIVFFTLGLFMFARTNPFQGTFWDPRFIFLSLGLIFVARALNTFPLSLILNIGRKIKIPFKHQVVIWWAGLRGAVTLLLAFSLETPNKNLIVNSTFIIIFFTNILISVTTRPIVNALDVKSSEPSANVMDPMPVSIHESTKHSPLSSHSAPIRLFKKFDEKILKKLFGGLPSDKLEREVFVREEAVRDRQKPVAPSTDIVHHQGGATPSAVATGIPSSLTRSLLASEDSSGVDLQPPGSSSLLLDGADDDIETR